MLGVANNLKRQSFVAILAKEAKMEVSGAPIAKTGTGLLLEAAQDNSQLGEVCDSWSQLANEGTFRLAIHSRTEGAHTDVLALRGADLECLFRDKSGLQLMKLAAAWEDGRHVSRPVRVTPVQPPKPPVPAATLTSGTEVWLSLWLFNVSTDVAGPMPFRVTVSDDSLMAQVDYQRPDGLWYGMYRLPVASLDEDLTEPGIYELEDPVNQGGTIVGLKPGQHKVVFATQRVDKPRGDQPYAGVEARLVAMEECLTPWESAKVLVEANVDDLLGPPEEFNLGDLSGALKSDFMAALSPAGLDVGGPEPYRLLKQADVTGTIIAIDRVTEPGCDLAVVYLSVGSKQALPPRLSAYTTGGFWRVRLPPCCALLPTAVVGATVTPSTLVADFVDPAVFHDNECSVDMDVLELELVASGLGMSYMHAMFRQFLCEVSRQCRRHHFRLVDTNYVTEAKVATLPVYPDLQAPKLFISGVKPAVKTENGASMVFSGKIAITDKLALPAAVKGWMQLHLSTEVETATPVFTAEDAVLQDQIVAAV